MCKIFSTCKGRGLQAEYGYQLRRGPISCPHSQLVQDHFEQPAPYLTFMQSTIHRASAFLKRYLFALGASPYLFTVGLRSARNRNLVNRIAWHFGYGNVPRKLPKTLVEQVCPQHEAVELLEVTAQNGNVSPWELFVLPRLTKCKRPKTIFEFGTFDGRTTLDLAVNLRSRSGDLHSRFAKICNRRCKLAA